MDKLDTMQSNAEDITEESTGTRADFPGKGERPRKIA